MIKFLRRLLRVTLALLLLLAGLIFFIVATETGLTVALNIADKVAPGLISYDRISGRLAGPLLLENIGYQDGSGLEFQLRRAEFNWHPRQLFSAELLVDELELEGITLRLPAPAEEKPEPTEPLTLPDIQLPLSVEINQLTLKDIHIYPYQATQPVIVNELQLQAKTIDDRLEIEKLQVSTPEATVQLDGQLTPVAAYPLALQFSWSFQHDQIGDISGNGRLNGALTERINIQHETSGTVTSTLDGSAGDLFTDPGWDTEIAIEVADLGRFVPDLNQAGLTGQIQTKGTLNDFQLNSRMNTRLPEIGPVMAVLDTSGSTRALRIRQLQLNAAEHPLALNVEADIDIEQQIVTAQGSWQDLAWPPNNDARIRSPQGEFDLQGTLADYRLTLSTRVSGDEFGILDASINADGSDKKVYLRKFDVSSPQRELGLEAVGEITIDGLDGKLNVSWHDLRWPLTESDAPQILVPRGQLEFNGSPKAYQLQLNTDIDGPQLTPLNVSLTADGSDQRLNLSEAFINASQKDLSLNAQANVSFSDLKFNASGEWQNVIWPLDGQEPVIAESQQGSFSAQGTPDNYTFKLAAAVQGKDIPEGNWQLDGQGSDQALETLNLQGQTLSGQIDAQISARWQPDVSWQVKLSGADIDPGVKWPDVPGKLGFALNTEGAISQNPVSDSSAYVDEVLKENVQGIKAKLQLEELSGTLSGQEVRGTAQLAVNNQDIDVQSIELHAGEAELQAQGMIGKELALDWKLQVPSLKGLLPGAQGSIEGSGQLTGTREQPGADLQIKLNQLAYGENRIDTLQGEAKVDISGNDQSTLNFKGSGLVVAGQTWQSLSLNGDGTPAKHQAELALTGDLGQFALALAGGLEGEVWQGVLNQLSATKTLAGDWNLDKPMPLSLSPQAVTAEQSCLSSQPARVCIQGNWEQTQGATAKLTFNDFNLNRFQEFLPPELTLNNRLNGEANASSGVDGSLSAEADVSLSAGDVKFEIEGEPLIISLGESTFNASSDGRNADTQLQVDLGTLGNLNASVKLEDLTGKRGINGTLKANIDSLKPVSGFVPQAQDIEGKVTADLSLAGALPVPVIQGNIQLLDASVSIPVAGIDVEDVELTISSDGNGPLSLSGGARSGSGSIELSGQVEPFEPKLDLNIKGDQFQAMNSHEIQAVISPDMSIHLDQSQVQVDGEVTIPKAYISPPGSSAAGGVSVSQDVVIVREADGEPEQASAAVDIFAKIRVILGDDVVVEAAGFKGQLKGDLLIEQTPQLAPRGTGNIEVAAGNYEIYGQELAIERGMVLFSGGPIDNPGLDLRISRAYDEVTVGAQVGGSIREPRLNLFSQPGMPDSSIISYLAFGRGPGENSSSENALLYQAATALGTAGGRSITKNISDTLGLDELSFEGGNNLDEASLVVGKYLSPELYVSYGLGLFEAVNTFNLRYKINERLSFESSTSGDHSSADIIYTIER